MKKFIRSWLIGSSSLFAVVLGIAVLLCFVSWNWVLFSHADYWGLARVCCAAGFVGAFWELTK